MTDKYRTDSWLMDIFEGWFDPCPIRWTPFDQECALSYDWGLRAHAKKIFVNPPYSKPLPFVMKALETKTAYPEATIAMLLKHDSSTQAWAQLKEHGAHFLPIMGRLKHHTGHSAAFPSVLVIL